MSASIEREVYPRHLGEITREDSRADVTEELVRMMVAAPGGKLAASD